LRVRLCLAVVPKVAHKPGTSCLESQGDDMLNVSNESNSRSSIETGLFNQIALFSASGLAMSMAFVFVGGVRILYPWF
jgi:hypothetical protein